MLRLALPAGCGRSHTGSAFPGRSLGTRATTQETRSQAGAWERGAEGLAGEEAIAPPDPRPVRLLRFRVRRRPS
ncbi:hypothetical protein Mal15_10110 [Stieleria maiorica]|uniref:Uncharacterized protein n=1 Tax=Stieleria maiorica TaxID=2795974 RepID=A0A5B9M754_9BACT|nr:hypothetical protein Mal15_10110 [Stieleria maiorica]